MSAAGTRLLTRLSREAQELGTFVPGALDRGYYNDLTAIARTHGTPTAAAVALRGLVADRLRTNPVSVAQLGLGAWQLEDGNGAWLDVAREAAAWLAGALDERGRVPYLFPMTHTYAIQAPWLSAMAQGEAASLLARIATCDRDDALRAAAVAAVTPLLDSETGLTAPTADGTVLQEYPTSPPAHVLNGWVFALWGLHDVGLVAGGELGADEAFERGAETLARRLPLYETPRCWSRYDLYPHRLTHVASPFYHRLHVSLLRATHALRPDLEALRLTADRWEESSHSVIAVSLAVGRKAAFRAVVPRGRPTPGAAA